MPNHYSVNCPLCGCGAAAIADAWVSDAIIQSGTVVLVCGIDYAAFEEIIRPVFSQMPSNFANHFGASFLPYRSGFGHNWDFTLVVAGEGNENIQALLKEIAPRVQRLVVFGPMSGRDSASLRDGSLNLPRSTHIISGFDLRGDRRLYFTEAMQTALATLTRMRRRSLRRNILPVI